MRPLSSFHIIEFFVRLRSAEQRPAAAGSAPSAFPAQRRDELLASLYRAN